jgi:hypothetical protein
MTILVMQVNMMASAMMQTSSGTGTVSDLAPGKHLQQKWNFFASLL